MEQPLWCSWPAFGASPEVGLWKNVESNRVTIIRTSEERGEFKATVEKNRQADRLGQEADLDARRRIATTGL